jgi:hypothetical protein
MSFDETSSAYTLKYHLEPLFEKLSARKPIQLAAEMQRKHQHELQALANAKMDKINAMGKLDTAASEAATMKLQHEHKVLRDAALLRHKAESVQLNVDMSMSGHMLDLCSLNVSLIHSFRAYQEARAKELKEQGDKAAAAHAQ